VRTLSGYGIAAALVLVAPNLVAWITGYPRRLHDLNIFSVGFALGLVGMYIAANVYGYHK